MATRTEVVGDVYDSLGYPVTQGVITIRLQQDIISIDGTKVAPYKVEVDLSVTSGAVDVFLYSTVAAETPDVYYLVEFDPDPDETTKNVTKRDGYWRNRWDVPNVLSKDLGSFPVL